MQVVFFSNAPNQLSNFRPDLSQLYRSESQLKDTRKDPVVFKTTGIAGSRTVAAPHVMSTYDLAEDEDGIDQVEEEIPVLTGAPQVTDPVEFDRSNAGRLAHKLCLVCKMPVGPTHSLRIGEDNRIYF